MADAHESCTIAQARCQLASICAACMLCARRTSGSCASLAAAECEASSFCPRLAEIEKLSGWKLFRGHVWVVLAERLLPWGSLHASGWGHAAWWGHPWSEAWGWHHAWGAAWETSWEAWGRHASGEAWWGHPWSHLGGKGTDRHTQSGPFGVKQCFAQ